MVVKTRNVPAVAAALKLHHPRPCSWLEGFASVDPFFIAPPVKRWILVTGTSLPEPSKDVDQCFRFVIELSRKLGEVQIFHANRGLHYHAWIKAQRGVIVRAYAWAGGTLWLQGAPTHAETDLGLKWFDYGDTVPATPEEAFSVVEKNTEKVPLLAARWGLDPAFIKGHILSNEHGITGKAPLHYR